MKTVHDRTFGKLRKMMGKGKKAMLYKKSGFLLQKSIVVALLAAVWVGVCVWVCGGGGGALPMLKAG